MPVEIVVAAAPFDAELQADRRLRSSCDRLPRGAQDLLERRDARARVVRPRPAVMRTHRSQPGSRRSVADEHAARRERRDDAGERVADADEHEVAVARPVSQAEPLAARRRAASRDAAACVEIPVAVVAILERGRQRRRGPGVQAVGRNDAAQRRQRRRRADERRRRGARRGRRPWRTSGRRPGSASRRTPRASISVSPAKSA